MNQLATWIKHATARLSIEEARAFTTSREFLEALCAHEHYNPQNCSRALAKLSLMNVKTSEEAWQIALSTAKVALSEEIFEDPYILSDPSKIAQLEASWAEREMVNLGYAPPHWNQIQFCECCGWMPVKERGACPWCPTKLGIKFYQLKENLCTK